MSHLNILYLKWISLPVRMSQTCATRLPKVRLTSSSTSGSACPQLTSSSLCLPMKWASQMRPRSSQRPHRLSLFPKSQLPTVQKARQCILPRGLLRARSTLAALTVPRPLPRCLRCAVLCTTASQNSTSRRRERPTTTARRTTQHSTPTSARQMVPHSPKHSNKIKRTT